MKTFDLPQVSGKCLRKAFNQRTNQNETGNNYQII